jgi:large subunit ribosomal protein L44
VLGRFKKEQRSDIRSSSAFQQGFVAARQFVHANFLSRTADIAGLLKFSNPKYSLSSTLSKQGLAPPTTRILAETGRLSIAPIFVLGIYSGSLKLGEGYGSSLAMAEFRACEDALRRVYLSSQAKFEDIFMPIASTGKNGKKTLSTVEKLESADGITGYPSDTIVNPGRKYEASKPLMDDETPYQSSGRSSVVSR